MKKKTILSLAFIMIVLTLVATSFALLRSSSVANGSVRTATWSISRSQSQSGDSLDIIPGTSGDTYDLTVTSTSEVDITYRIIIRNLPSGVEVALDEGAYQPPTSGTVTISNAQTVINYNDENKTKHHTLTFRAASGTGTVNSQSINIDVEFKQTL